MDIEKDNIIKYLKALYLRIFINHNNYHNLSYIHQDCFKQTLEIVYLIIKDICQNENVSLNNIRYLCSGSYSSVLCIKDKIIKYGIPRATKKFPNNPYVNAMLLRKEFTICHNETLFVEVNERVDTNCTITEEELYQLYKKMRQLHLVWLDVEKRNVGKLLKDNHAYWKKELPLNDKTLGLDKYRGNEVLKKGDLVIIDNDMIYDENSSYIYNQYKSKYQIEFEKRYLNELNAYPQKSGKVLMKK